MSSLRNAVKRKEHKERSQPEFRKKFGLLEKKKDYRERADDFNKKQRTTQHLRRLAEDRNPDEFYFAMQNAATKDGVHVAKTTQQNKYSQEELALMRTQDVAYLRTKSQADAKRAERLKASLHFLGIARPANHTIFVDEDEALREFDAAKYFDTPAELLTRSFNRPRNSQLEKADLLAQLDSGKANPSKMSRRLHSAYNELAQRQVRQKKVAGLASEMELKQAVAGKGRKRKLSQEEAGASGKVFKWKRERKR